MFLEFSEIQSVLRASINITLRWIRRNYSYECDRTVPRNFSWNSFRESNFKMLWIRNFSEVSEIQGGHFFITIIFPDFSLLFPDFQAANFFCILVKEQGNRSCAAFLFIRIIKFPDYSKNLKDSLTFSGFPDFPENGHPEITQFIGI